MAVLPLYPVNLHASQPFPSYIFTFDRLRPDGWEKIMMGITTPSEVVRVTQQEELEEIG